MNITSAKYWRPITGSGDNTCIIVVSEGKTMFVPLDANNKDYQAVMAWVEAGNTIEAAD
jgi:hypothetical protein